MSTPSSSYGAEFNELREALRVSDERFEAFMAHAPALCWIADAEDRLILLNPPLARLLRLDEATAVGRPLVELFPEASAKELVAKSGWVRQTRQRSETLAKGPWPDGSDGEYLVTNFSVALGAGETGVGGIAVEVSERRRFEQQLRQSQRLESLGLLAEGVAHHFNNMLTIIRVNAELLSLTPALPADAVRSVQQINEASERSAQLTTQLLAFSRQQPESVAIFDLNEVVRRLMDLLMIVLGRKIGIDAQLATAPVRLEGDVTMLEQLLLTLAINAREAMPAGGRLTIRVESVEVGAAEAERHPGAAAGPHARLVVRDTGVGMSPEVLPRVFEAFYTTKGGRHTGLGLSTVHGYVCHHQGWIEVASAPDAGATFTIHLPLAKPPPAIA